MKANHKTTLNRQNGFSMIEVLVASTILVVLVMMLAMLFQQTGAAWRTGVKRADGYLQIRSLIGAVQHDATAAVDQDTIPLSLRQQLGGGNQLFSGSTLQFYTLTGTGFDDQGSLNYSPAASDVFRTLKYITYNLSSGKRTERTLKVGSAGSMITTSVSDLLTRSGNLNAASTVPSSVTAVSGVGSGLPLYLHFSATVTTRGYALDIGAASAGPDKTWDTDDDIRTWTKE